LDRITVTEPVRPFSSHGGKLIFYHGLSDPWFSAKDTINCYQRMTMANGGESKMKDWSRLFLSPGMGHCSGGSATLDTFDMLSASVSWVEKGQSTRIGNRTSVPRSQPSPVCLPLGCSIQGARQHG
jgi:hypothetical protein